MPTEMNEIEALGLDEPIPAEVNGNRNGVVQDDAWDAAYHPCTEATMDVETSGEVVSYKDWRESAVYPGTARDLWVYIPPDCEPGANVIIFNDGRWYLARNGPVRATRVLDVLHDAGEISNTVAVFVTPGVPDTSPARKPIESYGDRESQRSWEYDRITPDYGEFLFGDVLPFVCQTHGLSISEQPGARTLCGISSGGIAAFNAAWHHPDQCSRVLSHCGSFTDIWGGHHYPSLVRRTERKPIRVMLQSGQHDANTPFGDWALANQAMASALEYAGYDYRFDYGTGGHNLRHGGAIFADSLRWLWR